MARYLARFLDPDGAVYGLPTYPWQSAPADLFTRRQLREMGRSPGGQPVSAQVMWRRGRADAVAYLYDLAGTRPKREATPAVLDAVGKALTARRTCPTCRRVRPYFIPRRFGECLDCAEDAGRLARTEAA